MRHMFMALSVVLCGCGGGGESSGDGGGGFVDPISPGSTSVVGAYKLSSSGDSAESTDSVKVIVLPDAGFLAVSSVRSSMPSDDLPASLSVHHGSLLGTDALSASFIRYFEMDDGEEGVGSVSSSAEDDGTIQMTLRTGILVPGSYAGPPADGGMVTGYNLSRFMFFIRSIVRDSEENFGSTIANVAGLHVGILRSGGKTIDVALAINGAGIIETAVIEDDCSMDGIAYPADVAFVMELVFTGQGCSFVPAQTMRGILVRDNGYLILVAFDGEGRNPVYFGESLQ